MSSFPSRKKTLSDFLVCEMIFFFQLYENDSYYVKCNTLNVFVFCLGAGPENVHGFSEYVYSMSYYLVPMNKTRIINELGHKSRIRTNVLGISGGFGVVFLRHIYISVPIP